MGDAGKPQINVLGGLGNDTNAPLMQTNLWSK